MQVNGNWMNSRENVKLHKDRTPGSGLKFDQSLKMDKKYLQLLKVYWFASGGTLNGST